MLEERADMVLLQVVKVHMVRPQRILFLRMMCFLHEFLQGVYLSPCEEGELHNLTTLILCLLSCLLSRVKQMLIVFSQFASPDNVPCL